MCSVEELIRARFHGAGPLRLYTFGRRVPFYLWIREAGITLELGAKRTPSNLSWPCLEGIVAFLRPHPAGVKAGGQHDEGEPGTLDEYTKETCVKRDVARWLTVVLSEAGVVEVTETPTQALALRLSERCR